MALEDTKMEMEAAKQEHNHGYANDAVKRVSHLAQNLAPY